VTRLASLLVLMLSLAGCGSQALREIGVPPTMSPVGAGLEANGHSIYSYPPKPAGPPARFSLWDDRQSRLFTDPRAYQTGDILTVLISINDRAKIKNESERNRTSRRTLGIAGSFDIDGTGSELKADGDIHSGTDSQGTGETKRSESIDLSIAAVVTEVLPNGNLIIEGTQEVRVNAELRVLTIAGVVRPSDIGASNTIPYARIAEARVSYGGRGRLTEVQQPPYGQQILDIVLPF
jgi:flagellar L-ring protein precursor FlgH